MGLSDQEQLNDYFKKVKEVDDKMLNLESYREYLFEQIDEIHSKSGE